ncbi:MAG TPA: lycopene cyclase domain-containing protein [Patescibacteria group bacterium]|nr:lycopene cyclase domain-containing protein [Patescibacteria group bacterium]
MINYQYTYLIGDFIFLAVWAVIFLWKKNTKKEMLILSVLFGIAGIIAEIIYIKDWWRPLTITHTPVGIEDFLFGFSAGGIMSVIYEAIFKKKIRIKKARKKKKIKRNLEFLFIISLLSILFLGSFFLLKLNSLFSTLIAFAVPISIIYIKRKDLITDSLATGVLAVLIAIIAYNLLDLMTPGWIQKFWLFENMQKIIILNVPIQEIIWYMLAGMFIGPLYEYWQEGRLINKKR